MLVTERVEKVDQILKDVCILESTLAQLNVQQKILKGKLIAYLRVNQFEFLSEQLYELFLDFLPSDSSEQNSIGS
ncbi:unnamed protein product [Rodentolepis nana]|uniref:Transposase n=1 Tax=Rodentolepis nana TaxID=102285 RepID=A0A0R3T047_RODNA|nr:unnamed protein product [Rodentolepis nana]